MHWNDFNVTEGGAYKRVFDFDPTVLSSLSWIKKKKKKKRETVAIPDFRPYAVTLLGLPDNDWVKYAEFPELMHTRN